MTITNYKFPFPKLTPFSSDHPPTKAAINTFKEELYENASSITGISRGRHGLAALVMSAAEYATLTGTADIWAPPVDPGEQPPHPAGLSADDKKEANRQYDKLNEKWNKYDDAVKELKNQITQAVPDKYTNTLKVKVTGYASRSPYDLIKHITKTYGTVTAQDLRDNVKAMSREWLIGSPIEDLFKINEDAQKFAEPYNPISDLTMIIAATEQLQNTGVFEADLRDWELTAEVEKTWPNFKMLFTIANTMYHNKITAKSAGYAGKATTPLGSKDNNLPRTNKDPIFYCWSHGINRSHAGCDCKYKEDGHENKATFDNMLGGCNIIKRLPKEGSKINKTKKTVSP